MPNKYNVMSSRKNQLKAIIGEAIAFEVMPTELKAFCVAQLIGQISNEIFDYPIHGASTSIPFHFIMLMSLARQMRAASILALRSWSPSSVS